MSWARFLVAMLPAATELLRELFREFQGDPERAKGALKRIRDHWRTMPEIERQVDAILDEARDRQKPPPLP
jgi:hypothetical protein